MRDITENPWEIALMLGAREWNKILVKNQLKSEKWWRNRLQKLLDEIPDVNFPEVILNPGIYDNDENLISDPIPYEIEILGWSKEEFNAVLV